MIRTSGGWLSSAGSAATYECVITRSRQSAPCDAGKPPRRDRIRPIGCSTERAASGASISPGSAESDKHDDRDRKIVTLAPLEVHRRDSALSVATGHRSNDQQNRGPGKSSRGLCRSVSCGELAPETSIRRVGPPEGDRARTADATGGNIGEKNGPQRPIDVCGLRMPAIRIDLSGLIHVKIDVRVELWIGGPRITTTTSTHDIIGWWRKD